MKVIASLTLTMILLFSTIFVGSMETGTVQAYEQVIGIITSDTTWTKANSPYNLTGPLAVQTGVTLTIEAGVTVNLNKFYILVNGTLTAIGTSADKINFNDGYLYFTEVSNGWNEETGAGSIIQHAIFRFDSADYLSSLPQYIQLVSSVKIDRDIFYDKTDSFGRSRVLFLIRADSGIITNNLLIGKGCAGISCTRDAIISDNKITGCDEGIFLYYGAPVIERNLITNCTIRGMTITYDGFNMLNALIQENTIINNKNGIDIFGNGNFIHPTIANNSIYNNQNYNLYLADSTLSSTISQDVNVTSNWWGTTDSNEIGQKIYDFNDNFNCGNAIFSPFLTQPSSSAPTEDYTSVPTPTPPLIPQSPSWMLPFLVIATLCALALTKKVVNRKIKEAPIMSS